MHEDNRVALTLGISTVVKISGNHHPHPHAKGRRQEETREVRVQGSEKKETCWV